MTIDALARGAAVAAGLLYCPSARSDPAPPLAPLPQATPVLAVDDIRAHGPTARNWIDLAIDTEHIVAPGSQDATEITEQLSIGLPTFGARELRDVLAVFEPYELRLRSTTVHSSAGVQQGPLTIGLQRYFPFEPVSITPLAYAHLGVEAVISSPWLSDRHATPPPAVRIVNGVDTELAQNGWSLRPVSAYLRADFLACRSAFADLGAAPEAFVPTTGATEYDVRFHVAWGWSFGCADRVAARRPKVSFEYRGRARLHAGDAPPDYRDSLGLGLQYDLGGFVVQALGSTDPGQHMLDYWMLGLRLQFGLAKGG